MHQFKDSESTLSLLVLDSSKRKEGRQPDKQHASVIFYRYSLQGPHFLSELHCIPKQSEAAQICVTTVHRKQLMATWCRHCNFSKTCKRMIVAAAFSVLCQIRSASYLQTAAGPCGAAYFSSFFMLTVS